MTNNSQEEANYCSSSDYTLSTFLTWGIGSLKGVKSHARAHKCLFWWPSQNWTLWTPCLHSVLLAILCLQFSHWGAGVRAGCPSCSPLQQCRSRTKPGSPLLPLVLLPQEDTSISERQNCRSTQQTSKAGMVQITLISSRKTLSLRKTFFSF